MKNFFKTRIALIFSSLLALILCSSSTKLTPPSGLQFEISFPEAANKGPITGRVYVMISDRPNGEPRLQISTNGIPFFGKDVEALQAGKPAVIDQTTFGYPLKSLLELPAGEYYIQGFINIYTEFKRSDGFTLWMHNDQWEGQHFNRSPGNLYSDIQKIRIDPKQKQVVKLSCKNVIPPINPIPDTKWVKRVKFKSEMLSKF